MSQLNDDVSKNQWKPRLKGGNRRRAPAGSGSSAAAAMAMASITAIDKCRVRGETVDVAMLERASRSISPQSGKPSAVTSPRKAKAGNGWLPWAVVACVIAGGAACLRLFPGSGRHSVAGTVLVGRMPLAGAELWFHPGPFGEPAARVTTADDGGFRLADLPPGEYKVTVHASGPAAQQVPSAYIKPDSTLFTLHVNRDLEKLRMYAVAPARATRKPAAGADY